MFYFRFIFVEGKLQIYTIIKSLVPYFFLGNYWQQLIMRIGQL